MNLKPEELGIVSNVFRIPVSDLEFRANTSRQGFHGPISAKMWERTSKLDSSYEDTFDYSVYDQIYDRFGDKQPRGGVVYRGLFKLANFHSSCTRCHYALELDTYGRGCVHNCTYCYAKDQLTSHGMWNQPYPFPMDVSELRKLLYTVFETDKRSKWRDVLQRRIPIRIGSMSDSFMWLDRKYRISFETLKLLKHYRYPYVIFTRSDLIATKEYLDVLDPSLGAVHFSISGLNDEYTKLLEPGAPSVERRLKALTALSSAGIRTAIRLNPLFPKYPDGYFTNPEILEGKFEGNIPSFNFFDIDNSQEFVSKVKETGASTILAGFVRLSGYSINSISRATGVNVKAFFTKGNFKGNEDRSYTDAEMAHYYKILHSACKSQDIRFTTCYIGTGISEYFNHQKLWANKQDCCDIKGYVSSFTATSQDIPWETRTQFAPKKDTALSARQMDESISKSLDGKKAVKQPSKILDFESSP